MQHIDTAPPPSDRLHIGDCVVTLSSREVQAPGASSPLRLTPKALSVLLVLVRHAGNVVTRDELFAQVWPDTLPTNDVLTQAITQLRKALASAASPDAHGGIETIAKSGYRLLAPVAWESPAIDIDPLPAAVPSSSAEPPARAETDAGTTGPGSAGWRRRALTAAAMLLLSCSLLLCWLLLRRPAPESALEKATADGTSIIGSPERPYRLITATQGINASPTLSPDGALVVYAEEHAGGSALKVQSTAGTVPMALVQAPSGALDRFPAWSPDGREIAFARFFGDGRCEVLVVGATGGDARRAARCDGTEMLSFDWMPDGSGLVFGSMTGSTGTTGIRLLDLASGRWTSLDYPRSADDFDYAPRYSPDGQRIGFVRNPQLGGVWTMPARGGEVDRLTEESAEMRGWDWLDDHAIVMARRVDSESRLYRVELRSGLLKDLGVDDAQSPSVARLGGMLAFVHRGPQFGLFRVSLDAPEDKQRLFASSGRDTQPLIAPDGRQLVFNSNRSGTFALWWSRDERAESLHVIEGFRPEERQPADWSADSQTLLVNGRDQAGQPGIYEVQPEQGQWKQLPVPVREPLQAVYGAGRQVYVVARDERERTGLSLFERPATGPWRQLAYLPGVSQVRYDRGRGKVLFTRLAERGLWQVDADLAAASVLQLSSTEPSRWRFRTWALGPAGEILYLSQARGCSARLNRLDRELPPHCLSSDADVANNGFSVAPSGTEVHVALAVSDGTDIGVMAVPSTPARPLLGFFRLLNPLD